MLITLQNLRKEYDDLVAVNDLSVGIPKGAIYGLIGPNGAGKTTTFRMIAGLLEPTSGSAVITGFDVWRDSLHAFAKIGYLPDFFSLYEKLKVWEYLDFFAHSYKLPVADIPARIDKVLTDVSLMDKKDSFIAGLSRGMKQRLGIAKTLIHDPELIILDEPASGLDPLARKELMQLLLTINKSGKTILISSHILSELAEVCTHVGVLENGNLVKSGAIDSITAEETDTRKVAVDVLGDTSAILAFLKSQKKLKNVEATASGAVFEIIGDDVAVVRFHKLLMSKGFSVMSFVHRRKDISDIFMEVSQKK